MSESNGENVPWLTQKTEDCDATVTATVIEGAEVVRTAAVSYATPILHQVFIQKSPQPRDENFATTVSNSGPDFKTFRLSIASPSPHSNGLILKSDSNADKDPKTISSQSSTTSSVPLLVFPSSLLSSNSVVLKPVPATPKEAATPHLSPPSLAPSLSFASSPALSPFSIRTDDELTPLTWLQDSNLLMGTALSPIKHAPIVSKSRESLATTTDSKVASKVPQSGNRKGDLAPVEKLEDAKDTSETIKAESVDVVDCKVESPTSDYAEDNHSDVSGELPEATDVIVPKTSCSSSPTSSSSGPAPKSQQPVPYNPKVHIKAKPPFSFSCLIFMAIEESPTKALPVKDIYSWIVDHYPYYKSAPTGWKNSVRHNLSLNKCFSKVEKSSTLGKGSLWMVDPTFRPNLLHAMSKTPFIPQSSVDKNFLMDSSTLINPKYLYGLTGKTPEIMTMGTFMVQNDLAVVPSNSVTLHPASSSQATHRLANDLTLQHVPIVTHKELNHFNHGAHVNPVNLVNLQPISTERETQPSDSNCPANTDGTKVSRSGGSLYTPNPELFPRLAKRLEAHSVERGPDAGSLPVLFPPSSIEDVDAAAAMLVLKHGPRMLSPYRENFANFSANIEKVTDVCPSRNHKSSESSDSGSVVISSSPSLDHAYLHDSKGSRPYKPEGRKSSGKLFGKSNETSPTSSVDEAFFDDSFESDAVWDSPVTSSHSPRFYEETDALLNLAAVAASLASREELVNSGISVRLPGNDPAQSTRLSTESQPISYTESQVICKVNSPSRFNSPSHADKQSQQSVSQPVDQPNQQPINPTPSTNNPKTAKRKLKDVRIKSAKYNCTRNTTDLTNKNSANRAHCNNNNKAVVNRNKLLKVRKVLKVSRY